MKKNLLTIFAAVLSTGFASAQCTPDPALANEPFGLWPDSLATVYTYVGAGDQTRVVDLVTFADTTLTVTLGQPVDVLIYIDRFKITDVRNVPTGMTYGTNVENLAETGAPWGYWDNNGTVPNQTSTQGCVYINGTEDQWNTLAALANHGPDRGAVQLEIDVDVRIAGTLPDLTGIINPNSWMSSIPANLGGGVITVTDYWLVAENSAAGIVKVDQDKFMLVNNYVDQTGSTVIEFNAPYDMKGLEFNVYSILGSKVATKKFDVERGMNTVKFDGTLHASGLYVFTISDGNTTLTNKMYSK